MNAAWRLLPMTCPGGRLVCQGLAGFSAGNQAVPLAAGGSLAVPPLPRCAPRPHRSLSPFPGPGDPLEERSAPDAPQAFSATTSPGVRGGLLPLKPAGPQVCCERLPPQCGSEPPPHLPKDRARALGPAPSALPPGGRCWWGSCRLAGRDDRGRPRLSSSSAGPGQGSSPQLRPF